MMVVFFLTTESSYERFVEGELEAPRIESRDWLTDLSSRWLKAGPYVVVNHLVVEVAVTVHSVSDLDLLGQVTRFELRVAKVYFQCSSLREMAALGEFMTCFRD